MGVARNLEIKAAMSSSTVGALKRFLTKFPDDAVVYGYEEVAGIDVDGVGPSAIVVTDGNKGGIFPTGNYAWTSERHPSLDDS